MSEVRNALCRQEGNILQPIARKVKFSQQFQRNYRKTGHFHISQPQLIQPLHKGQQFGVIGPDRVDRQVEAAEAIEANEDVIREDSEAIIGQVE